MAVPDREPPLVAEGRRAGRPVPRVRALRQAHRARGWPADRPGLHTVGLTHRDASILGETSNMALTCGNLRADARTRTANRPITSRVRYQLRHAGGTRDCHPARPRDTSR